MEVITIFCSLVASDVISWSKESALLLSRPEVGSWGYRWE